MDRFLQQGCTRFRHGEGQSRDRGTMEKHGGASQRCETYNARCQATRVLRGPRDRDLQPQDQGSDAAGSPANMSLCGRRSEATGSSRPISGTTASRDCNPPSPPYPQKWSGDGALLPLFWLVGAICIAALWRVKSLLRHCSDRPKLERACPGSADPCYSKISLRFSSNSALSISPLANRSFKISRAREAVSYGSGPSSRLALRKPQQHMVKSSIRLGPTGPTSGHAPTRPACSPKCGLAL
jgi:hypothetical protein